MKFVFLLTEVSIQCLEYTYFDKAEVPIFFFFSNKGLKQTLVQVVGYTTNIICVK